MRPRPVHRRSSHGAALVAMAAVGVLAALGAVGGAAYGRPQLAPPALPTATSRLFGPDRYATAVAVSVATFPAGARVAYLATGGDYPDALTAAAAAGGRGPVLLGGAGGLPPWTVVELERLRPAQVVIVGGTRGLPATTEATVAAALPGVSVSRVQGTDRYATAAAVATATFRAPVPVAWVATGESFPDALSAAAAAGGRGPVLLVPPTGVPLATTLALGSLQPRHVYVVGGANAVSPGAQAVLARLLPHSTVTRVAGTDRYATAAAVSAVAFPAGATTAYLATGQAFPDALTAAAAAAGRGPVLLVGSATAPPAVTAEVHRLGPGHLVLVGGLAAVGDTVMKEMVASLGPAATASTTSTAPTATPQTQAPKTRAPQAQPPQTQRPQAQPPQAQPPGPPQPPPPTLLPPTSAVAIGVPTYPTAPAPTPAPTPFPTFPSVPTGTTPPPATFPAIPPATSPPPVTTTQPPAGNPSQSPPPPRPGAAVAVSVAEAQVGKPYQWGGAGPASFDCSGLTMFAWAAAGVSLPHNAAAQAATLPVVTPDLAHLAPGDLLFFNDSVDHVAMYVGNAMMVEAAHSGVPVRIVALRTSGLVSAGRP